MFTFFRKLWMTIRFKTVYAEETNTMPKLIEVVMSCDTVEQVEVAEAYMAIFGKKFCISDDAFGTVGRAILAQMTEFMADTKQHIVHGWHRPNHNGNEPVHQYPNMNNYVGTILKVKFRSCWIEGKSSVIPE